MKDIHLWGVKQNNLKNIEVKIPVGSLTVICGPSGSGKSSLAFETLFAEGQRRFIESMSNYARQFLNKAPKPDIEGISNIPPAIAIEQKNSIKSSRSTVGTTTEIIDYLRLLYEKIGRSYCPTHHCPTEKESVTEATDKVIKNFNGKRGYVLVEISAEGRAAEGKKLHSLLLQDGYLRIYLPKVEAKKAAAKPAKKAGKKAKAIEVVPNEVAVTSEEMGTVVEIGDPAAVKKGLPKETFYLVIDRMSFNEDERGRIADSMSQAYEASIKYNSNLITRRATILTTEGTRLQVSEEASCPVCGYTPPPVTSRLFSFNSPIGACPTCKGFGNTLEVDEAKVVPNPNLSLAQGALSPFWMPSAAHEKKQLLAYCKKAKIDVHTPWKDLPKEHRDVIWTGNKEFFGVKGLFEYLDQIKYKMHVRVFISRFRSASVCPTCHGSRLRDEAQHVLINSSNITQLSVMTIEELCQFFQKIELTPHQIEVAGEVLKQIRARLEFLMRVGVHYLSLWPEPPS